jgi:hypothetical protein
MTMEKATYMAKITLNCKFQKLKIRAVKNLNHFLIRAKDSGDWKKGTITETEFQELLAKKIDTVKMNYAINDIKRFIRDTNKLAIWSPKYFHDLVNSLKVV